VKISIIGGGGLVGSCAAYALQFSGVVSEIALLDVHEELAAAQALDLQHGGPSTSDQRIYAGGYEHVRDSDFVCITAGLRRKPDESRLDLINRNVDLFLKILDQIETVGVSSETIVLVVSNPVDVLTYLAAQRLQLPCSQVIGLGTQLDTIRFRSLIAADLNVAPTQVSAVILGEHGDSMVPVWSSATIAGLPMDKYPDWNIQKAKELFKRTQGSGAEVIRGKGGAGFAVGVAIRDVIQPMALNQHCVLPISSVQQGCYGIRDVALSVPTVVGRSGVVKHHEIDLWPKEVQAIRQSGSVLRQTLQTVLARVG